MPGIIVHTLLGRTLLDRWRGGPAAPFPAGEPGLRAAFLAGCMGPVQQAAHDGYAGVGEGQLRRRPDRFGQVERPQHGIGIGEDIIGVMADVPQPQGR